MDNIKDYNNHKFLFRLKKFKSPTYIDFFSEDIYEWFIRVVVYLHKSGKINDTYTIIKKDLENHLDFYKNKGFNKK